MSPHPDPAPTQILAQERLDHSLRIAELLEQRVTSICTDFAVTDQLIRNQVRPHFQAGARQLRKFRFFPRLRALQRAVMSLTFYRWFIRFHPLSLLFHGEIWALWAVCVLMVLTWVSLGFFLLVLTLYLLWQGLRMMLAGGKS